MKLTICYQTNRKDPKIQWFLDSLKRQLLPTDDVRVVVVDFHAYQRDLSATIPVKDFAWVTPMPSVYQGKHRLTKEDFFDASSSRNTGLCLAPDGYLVYADDLSVLTDGWMNSVRHAMAGGYVVCGSYKKVRNLVVENGEIKSFNEFESGIDNRLKHVSQDVSICGGNWLYGCSCGAPVEAWLSVNGWPTDLCGSLGFEDCIMGIALQNAGHQLRYDRRMMTLESEEHHHLDKPFKKDDWHFESGVPVRGGNGKDDKSHAALHIAMKSKFFPNSFGEGGIRAVRSRVLAGDPFPVIQTPDRDWYSGILLSEM